MPDTNAIPIVGPLASRAFVGVSPRGICSDEFAQVNLADQFATARYVSLATRRRDGREVLTPVWMAPADAALYVFSEAHLGKVKRIRANPQVRLARCEMRGKVLSDWTAATARLIDDPTTLSIAYRALRAKYGWQMWLLDCMSKLAGRYDKRMIIELRA